MLDQLKKEQFNETTLLYFSINLNCYDILQIESFSSSHWMLHIILLSFHKVMSENNLSQFLIFPYQISKQNNFLFLSEPSFELRVLLHKFTLIHQQTIIPLEIFLSIHKKNIYCTFVVQFHRLKFGDTIPYISVLSHIL